MTRTTSHDEMVVAVRTFEQKQQDSNIRWFAEQTRACEAPDATAADVQERMYKLARTLKLSSWEILAQNYKIISSADLLSAVDVGQSDKGTRPLSSEQRQAFLESLKKAINEDFDQAALDFKPNYLPENYGLLLSVTKGLRDTDLRASAVCGVDGI
ncbi:hypothetical protein LTR62_000954 [Meristemomyces frigidus]|uniref:Uncharacterized protein n=1 Tax=Meristemomyces frigidus TaxID=1508187 RepID=A0AAN7T9M2_9PEZI|nr:hypothetical protein LTR62_000954 [Meristemomyces frigidus]